MNNIVSVHSMITSALKNIVRVNKTEETEANIVYDNCLSLYISFIQN